MVNCNPETVSTDYDISDRLYFEPLTLEDVLSVVRRENPKGIIVQFGGQTPLNIARNLADSGVNILGTSIDAIAMAEDRKKFSSMLEKLGLNQPRNSSATELDEALKLASKIGYPVLMRPSFVLGGAKMEVIHDEPMLVQYWQQLVEYCMNTDVHIDSTHPILIDRFLENAIEVDVDAICDGSDVYIAGIMEHIEQAGIHSGDSSCVLPPFSLENDIISEIEEATTKLALELKIKGLMNIQFAIKDKEVFILEVNPRASRTVPFVSKVTGIPVAKMATKVMLGATIDDLGLKKRVDPEYVGVKTSVFPWTRFPGTDIITGPEMKSTGEVMGIGDSFPQAYAKSLIGAGMKLPLSGTVFISLRKEDKEHVAKLAQDLYQMGFEIIATDGTALLILENKIPVRTIRKIYEGESPDILDLMEDNQVQMIINTPSNKTPLSDEISIRTNAVIRNIPLITTVSAAKAVIRAIKKMREDGDLPVKALQDFHRTVGIEYHMK